MVSMPPDDQIARGRRRLERLWRAGTALLGSELALMGGAMTWVSEHRLVAALSNAGGFGVHRLRRHGAGSAGRRDRR